MRKIYKNILAYSFLLFSSLTANSQVNITPSEVCVDMQRVKDEASTDINIEIYYEEAPNLILKRGGTVEGWPAGYYASGNEITFSGEFLDIDVSGHGCDYKELRIGYLTTEIAVDGDTVDVPSISAGWPDPIIKSNYRIDFSMDQTATISGVFDKVSVGGYSTYLISEICLTNQECGTLNTEDLSTSNVSIYPNPTNGIFSLNISTNVSSIDLFDVTGRVIETRMNISGTQSFDISNLPSGVYFAKVSNSTSPFTQRVIKK